MSDEGIYRLLEAMGDRVTDLSKSYRVLNDNHTTLHLEVVELKAQLKTTVSIAKWLFGISGLSLLLRILEIVGVVK